MHDLAILAVLLAEVVVLARLDRRRFGTWVTPFTVLGCPYAAVAVLAYFFAPMFDFVPLYMGSVVVWVKGLFVLWAAGAFLGWALLDLRLAPRWQEVRFWQVSMCPDDDENLGLATWLAWAAIPVMLYGVLVSVRAAGGWSEIGSEDFRDAFGHGIHAHAVVLATLLPILLIGLYRRGSKFAIVTIALLLAFLTLGRVKGTILQAIIGGVFFRMLRGGFRLSLKKIALVVASTYVMFNVVYIIGMKVFLSDNPWNAEIYTYLGRHYLFYLFAGVLGFGEALRSGVADIGGNWQTIFAPLLNLYHAVFGGPLVAAGSAHEKGMFTDLLTDAGQTNVYTAIGTLHLYFGALGAALYLFVMGLACYGFLIAVRQNKNVWITASYCLIAAQLALGFFEFYFWYLTSYEVIVMGVLLMMTSKARWRFAARARPAHGV
jgi:oligosaccharide repeat unit polymerase